MEVRASRSAAPAPADAQAQGFAHASQLPDRQFRDRDRDRDRRAASSSPGFARRAAHELDRRPGARQAAWALLDHEPVPPRSDAQATSRTAEHHRMISGSGPIGWLARSVVRSHPRDPRGSDASMWRPGCCELFDEDDAVSGCDIVPAHQVRWAQSRRHRYPASFPTVVCRDGGGDVGPRRRSASRRSPSLVPRPQGANR